MALSDEINSCESIPGAPASPRYNQRDQIFCGDASVLGNLNVAGETELDSLTIGSPAITDPTKGITINGTTYVPAIIEIPGPLAGVVMSLPDGSPVQFLPGTAILVAVSPSGASTV